MTTTIAARPASLLPTMLATGLALVGNPAQAAQALDLETRLEQAAQACESGDNAGLERISLGVRQLMAEQPQALAPHRQYLEQWLFLFRHGICRPEQVTADKNAKSGKTSIKKGKTDWSSAQVSIAAGYLDNVNLGTRHDRLAINNPFGEGDLELQVGKESRPLSSSFVSVKGVYVVPRQEENGVDYVAALQQLYTDEPDFNLTGVAAGRQWLDNGKETAANISFVTDARQNQRGSIGGAYHHPLGGSATTGNSLDLGVRHDFYPGQQEQGALVAEARLSQQRLLENGGRFQLGAGVQYDRALGDRPGGDRPQLELSAQWDGATVAGWQPSAGVTLSYKRDQKPFNQALFSDRVRNQTRTVVDIGLAKKISNNKRILVQYNYDRIRDSEIPLFDLPDGNTVSVALEIPLGQ